MPINSDKSRVLGYYKVRLVGGGLSISIPQAFVDATNLTRGMYVKLIQESDKLVVIPIKEE